MGSNAEFLKQIVVTFKAELEERLQTITDGLLALERGSPEGVDLSPTINEIFRAAHNIKGAAHGIGIADVGEIAHHVETLFSSIQTQTLAISPEIITLCLQAVDRMREAMQCFIDEKPLLFDLKKLLKQLEQGQTAPGLKLPSTPETPHKPTETKPKPDEFQQQVMEIFKAELEERLELITNALLEFEQNEKQGMDSTKTIEAIFRAAHNVKGSARGIGLTNIGEIAHHVETLFAAVQKKSIEVSADMINLCLWAVDCMREAMQCFLENKPPEFDLEDLLLRLQQAAAGKLEKKQPPLPQVPITEPQAPAAKTSEYETIRVAVDNLDRVSAYMEEMQVNKIAMDDDFNQLVKLNNRMKQFMLNWRKNSLEFNNSRNGENTYLLEDIAHNISQMHKEMQVHINEYTVLFSALQDEVRMLRLIPVATLLRNLPRVVRDIAQSLRKSVELVIKDNDVKIDKMVLEGLKDPIIHILRNAIDHGIESVEWRKKSGKPEMGRISIEVLEEGNQIIFNISDDGGGIDINKVAENALKKTILAKADLETLAKDEIIELIFRPGFSTKEIVSEISGRGVGLDVVKANLASLKGRVTVTTELGKGTTFHLRVPLTLATERGLIVSSNHQLFVMSTNSVERVLLLGIADVISMQGSQGILMDNHPIYLCALSEILQLPARKFSSDEQLPVVVIKKERDSVAILVDEVIGEREIVIKPLQFPLINVPCIAGATLSGNGQIIIVLNSADLIYNALHLEAQRV